MPEHRSHLPADGGPPDFTVLADGLIRRAFTVSMDLHQDLARLSPQDGGRHLPLRQRDGRPGRPAAAAPAPAHRQMTPAEAERLRRTLRQAIGALDEIIHGIRAAALAHAIAPQAPPAPPTTISPPDRRLHAVRHRRWTAERPR
ncbi:hypothetical protein AB0C21_05405 [Spirillospora sp. NPDC049024]